MEDILQYFEYDHLPSELQAISRPFSELANQLVAKTPRCPERTVALRKLLEAKDAAVRAKLWVPQRVPAVTETKTDGSA